MNQLIKKLYCNDVIRYVFFGGCTTGVNLVSFYILRQVQVPLTAANVSSIVLAVLFAYVVNSRFVFHDRCTTAREHVYTLGKFISGRLVTMVVEVAGVWLLVEKLHTGDMPGKFLTQFLVIVLNYLISKFFVFTGTEK